MNEKINATELGDGRFLLKKWSGGPIGASVVCFVVGLAAAWMVFSMLTSASNGKAPFVEVGTTVTAFFGAFSVVAMVYLFVRTYTQVEWDEKHGYVEERCLVGPAIGCWSKDQILGVALDYYLTAEKGNTRKRMPDVSTYRLLLITKNGRRMHLFEQAFSDTKKALEDRGKALADYIGIDYLGGGFEKFVYIIRAEDGTVRAELKEFSLITWYRESEDGKLGCLASVLSFVFLLIVPFVYVLVSK